ncbi:MAG: hypothetical protein IT360_17340, partial [Gemmatimonadaceae bacterium]|nr:hypothetical protein [Gemmatimonadaceae bacterium]
DDGSVGDALDEEVHTIVVDVARDVAAAAVRAFAAASGTHPWVNIDDAPTEATHAPAKLLGMEAADGAMAADSVIGSDRRSDSAYHEEQEEADQESRDRSPDDSPYADAPRPAETTHREIPADVAAAAGHGGAPDVMRLDDVLALSSPDGMAEDNPESMPEDPSIVRPAILRYAIITASYRLTLKGPDRGKWDVDLTHEADAPLATVERVARGVAKRAGEDSEPEHFSGESLQRALDAPAWVTTP